MIRIGNRLVNQYDIVRVVKGKDFLRITMSKKPELWWGEDDLWMPDHKFRVQLQSLDYYIAHHGFIEYSDGKFLARSKISWVRFKKCSVHFHTQNGMCFAVFNQDRVASLKEELDKE